MDGQLKITSEFISESEEHKNVLQDLNHCSLCGTKLVFKHRVDYTVLQVREDADCPTCCIRMKTREHGLH